MTLSILRKYNIGIHQQHLYKALKPSLKGEWFSATDGFTYSSHLSFHLDNLSLEFSMHSLGDRNSIVFKDASDRYLLIFERENFKRIGFCFRGKTYESAKFSSSISFPFTASEFKKFGKDAPDLYHFPDLKLGYHHVVMEEGSYLNPWNSSALKEQKNSQLQIIHYYEKKSFERSEGRMPENDDELRDFLIEENQPEIEAWEEVEPTKQDNWSKIISVLKPLK